MTIKPRHQGFTLIEMVIVIIIFLILVSIATTVLVQEFQIFNSGKSLINADWQIRIALDRMVRDIRGATSINTATTNTLTFHYVDDNSGTNTSYSLSNSKLLYSKSDGTSSVLADNIQALTFQYYDSNGTNLGNTPVISSIRYITITIGHNTGFNSTTAVYLWNKKN